MSIDELSIKYMRLRSALASAYGQPVWNSKHIDSLTDEIADTEFALAASGTSAATFPAAGVVTAGTAVAQL